MENPLVQELCGKLIRILNLMFYIWFITLMTEGYN